MFSLDKILFISSSISLRLGRITNLYNYYIEQNFFRKQKLSELKKELDTFIQEVKKINHELNSIKKECNLFICLIGKKLQRAIDFHYKNVSLSKLLYNYSQITLINYNTRNQYFKSAFLKQKFKAFSNYEFSTKKKINPN